MKWKITVKPVVACMLCIWLSMGSGVGTGTAAPERKQTAPTLIQTVQLRGEGTAAELLIAASAPTTYTSYKSTAPARLVIDFSQTAPAEALNSLSISKGPVKAVTLKRFDTDAGVLTRMELFLSQDIDPVISPSTERVGELLVSFPGYVDASDAKPAVAAAPVQEMSPVVPQAAGSGDAAPVEAAVKQEPVVSDQSEGLPALLTGIKSQEDGVAITTNRPVSDFKTFRLSRPDRVVLDIHQAQVGMADKLVVLNSTGVSTARIGSYPDKVRIVFDAINGSLDDAVITRSATGLHVAFPAQQPVRREVKAVAPQEQAAASAAKAAPAVAVPHEEPAAVVASTPAKASAVPTPKPVKRAEAAVDAAQVSAVDFQVVGDISRVMVKVSGSPVVEKPVKLPGSVAYRIRNVQLPRNLQRSLEAREFVSPVLRITPVVIRTKTGSDVLVRVTMKKDAGFDFRQEADILYLDFKHPADMAAAAAEPQKTAATQKAAPAAEPAAAPAKEEQMLQEAQQPESAGKFGYTGRKVTLEFADAEVRKIFQLLSEVSNKNFVLGDDVGGSISLKLVNVPWDQALDIILDTKGFDKREEGNIVFIRKSDSFKNFDKKRESKLDIPPNLPVTAKCLVMNTTASEVIPPLASLLTKYREVLSKEGSYALNASGSAGTISRPLIGSSSGRENLNEQGNVSSQSVYKAEYGSLVVDPNTNSIIINDTLEVIKKAEVIISSLDVPKKQVQIEARMVEASSSFSKEFGVQWGMHYRDGSGKILGINSFDTGFGGISAAPPTSGTFGPGLATGISFGTLASNIKIDARLSAAASIGLVKIISSPKIITSYGNGAEIKQGQKIPYQSSTSDKVETKFIEAVLQLKVTPNITPSGNVILDLDISNDSAGAGNPPQINTKSTKTQLTVRDEETVVIGGIFQDTETDFDQGVPYLMDVPFLGGLFKSNSKTKVKTEMLIFITPRLIDKNASTNYPNTKCEVIKAFN
ncbi:MAG: type IV pilus secretin PilQ [Geobacter sp.]|nr:type IV pilus secretin PilQ [Geobacter sp.]